MELLMGLAGGVLIGLAAVTMMLVAGRIAGISGIASGLLMPMRGDTLWRGVFVAGLLLGAVLIAVPLPHHLEASPVQGFWLAAAGLLVGFGSTVGNGCTSGHGVCGLARLSGRSFAAVIVFMATAMVTVWVVRHGF
ncbi:MAG: hypothetical protein COY40_03845 [Alphaproteobacteria bacterium CG_4_10_14_0_8_um_filter_53_9]|nr:MAG: hypothetical protein COY40_03845 [Alphaproteobacteria bacterium CG_4_10_14_0_8_um_filter_53_9]